MLVSDTSSARTANAGTTETRPRRGQGHQSSKGHHRLTPSPRPPVRHGSHLLPELEDRGGGILRGDIQGAVGPLELGAVLFSAAPGKEARERRLARTWGRAAGERKAGRHLEGAGRKPPAGTPTHTGPPRPSGRCVSVNTRDRTPREGRPLPVCLRVGNRFQGTRGETHGDGDGPAGSLAPW